jgi:hypothetical protein
MGLCGATSPGPTEQHGYVARLVTSIRVPRLGQDLLSQANPWRDWESCHRSGVTPGVAPVMTDRVA